MTWSQEEEGAAAVVVVVAQRRRPLHCLQLLLLLPQGMLLRLLAVDLQQRPLLPLRPWLLQVGCCWCHFWWCLQLPHHQQKRQALQQDHSAAANSAQLVEPAACQSPQVGGSAGWLCCCHAGRVLAHLRFHVRDYLSLQRLRRGVVVGDHPHSAVLC